MRKTREAGYRIEEASCSLVAPPILLGGGFRIVVALTGGENNVPAHAHLCGGGLSSPSEDRLRAMATIFSGGWICDFCRIA